MKKTGQALVEIVVAIGVAVLALLAISRVSSRSIFNAGAASRQNQAFNYAHNAIDMIKEMINSEGRAAQTDQLFTDTKTWCFNGVTVNTTNGTSFCTIGSTEFEGQVTMSRAPINGKDELTVVSQVRWVEGGLNRSVKNEAKFVLDQ